MKISFSIHYHTVWGEQLCLLGNTPELGNDIAQQALQMTWQEGDLWYVAIELPSQPPFTLQYQYLLKKDGTTLYDGTLRTVSITTDPPQLLQLIDTWIDAGAIEHAWTTTPFQQVFFPKELLPFEDANTPVTHVFRVKAPLLPFRQTMCIQGSDALLGNWHTQWPVMMRYEPDGWYTARMDLREATSFPIFYKYAVYDWQTHTFISYEKGDNRKVEVGIAPGQQVIVQDGLAHLEYIPWKGAGVAIPVFSLRSAESFGAGSFTDLRLLVDWAVKTGLQLIQLLPVNDTSATLTWEDSYPYAAISAFALHPLYIDLQKVGLLDKAHPIQQQYPALQQQLNKLDEMDYEAVLQFKNAYLDALYQQQYDTPWKTADYDSWFQQNSHWLIPYAVFCYLKSKYGTCDFTQWPDYQVYDTDKMKALLQPESDAYQKIQCIYFIQYHLHLQLQDAATYARSKGVVLKGDIPIGISRFSADAWCNPQLFNSAVQVGAPPDSFAMHGQNWGFPSYNWEVMAATNYHWWKLRFVQMADYFDAFRIDHILGFFRIWQIPMDAVQGVLGYFQPALPVTQDELHDKGIAFEATRYCMPYITGEILTAIFGSAAGMVKDTYITTDEQGHARMRTGFTTQRELYNYFQQQETAKKPVPAQVQDGLYTLVANVLFLQVSTAVGLQLHPRFGMSDTLSFKALDNATQQALSAVYHDYFYSRQENIWRNSALEKLPALLQGTNMLVCGEDLGMIPSCVPDVMAQLGILGLEIQRMPKINGTNFTDLNTVPYLSVVTPDTHDMSTLREWWQENAGMTSLFYNTVLGHTGEAPVSVTPALIKEIIEQHLHANAMWCIFQLQDLLALQEKWWTTPPAAERINIPATAKHYWRYRMPVLLEVLLEENDFNATLQQLVSARNHQP